MTIRVYRAGAAGPLPPDGTQVVLSRTNPHGTFALCYGAWNAANKTVRVAFHPGPVWAYSVKPDPGDTVTWLTDGTTAAPDPEPETVPVRPVWADDQCVIDSHGVMLHPCRRSDDYWSHPQWWRDHEPVTRVLDSEGRLVHPHYLAARAELDRLRIRRSDIADALHILTDVKGLLAEVADLICGDLPTVEAWQSISEPPDPDTLETADQDGSE